MKGYKAWVPIGLVVCLVLSFYMLFNTRITTAKEYDNYLSTARDYAKQGIAVDALENYAKALGIKNTIDVNVEVGNFYVKINDVVGAIGWGEQMVETFDTNPQAYEFLLSRYRENNDYNRCFALYDTIVKRKIESKSISSTMKEIKYVFYYGEAFDDVDVYSEGFCAVEYEGKWGLVNEIGEKSAPFMFKHIGPYIDELSPVIDENDEVYFIDNQGNKKKVVKIKDKVLSLSCAVGDNFALFNGKTWSFYNKKNEKISSDYTGTSLLANTVVAVEKDGKWNILNEDFNPISDKKYVEVVQDARGIIYRNGVIFVNDGSSFYMINKEGKSVSDQRFKNAKLFLDDTYAAVETDKGWTFVDSSGKFVFEDLYFEDAHSFINGFAAIKKDGQWGFIDIDGNIAIDCQFVDAKDFNSKGCAFVKNENIWQLIRLYSLNYEE
ncbi:MAG: WG repeat-containing protein [Clostridia bacterium]|nr:WG repeat-containing protein [Clostridia bacterium]